VNGPKLTDPPPPPLGNFVNGGFYTGSTLKLPAGVNLQLASSLVLVSAGTLQIDGIIQVGPVAAGATAIDIILVSLEGDVIIGQNAGVGFGVGPGGAAVAITGPLACATGGGASYGGLVKIVASKGSIRVLGTVAGQTGGNGGSATANDAPPPIVLPMIGHVTAVGGEGGEGGDVRLCAFESMSISGTVMSGEGGAGGAAQSTAIDSRSDDSQGGPGNTAGNVYLDGLAGTPCQVAITGEVRANPGGRGGNAVANGGPPGATSGGDGGATGGDGARGGTVLFNNCVVQPVGTVRAGIGGNGGDAEANGGLGANAALFWGWGGGDANATGGDGGKPGATPTIPTPTGNVQGIAAAPLGFAWPSGKGGDADATGGNGGIGGAIGAGGTSGSATAQGGMSGNTGAAGGKKVVPGVAGAPAPGGAGGVGPSASATGAP
jgi:hypothetical protein